MSGWQLPMNPQERMFYEQLPDEIRAVSPGATLSYKRRLGMVNSYLRELYGDRADWMRVLPGYEGASPDPVGGGTRVVVGCDGVTELDEAELDRWLSAEADDGALASEIAALFERLQAFDAPSEKPGSFERDRGNGADGQYGPVLFKCAELLGALPRLGVRSYYDHLIDRAGMTADDEEAFYRRLAANDDEDDRRAAAGSFSMLVRALAKRFTDGMMVNYGDTTVVMQPPGRYYYRGENAFYGSSRPGLFRGRATRMKPVEAFVSLLRMDEAGFFLDNFEAVREWPIGYGTVRYEALMQHYGLPTWTMDLTNDLTTALFFACCAFDGDAWRPLRDAEVSRADSRPQVHGRGGDSRFAVLYRNKAEVETMRFFLGANGEYAEGWSSGWHRAIPRNDEMYDEVVPIGYQPFMRCSAQHGYLLWASDESYDMYRDSRFEKFKLRLSGKLCERVFEMADGGRRAFPNGDIPKIERCLRDIGSTDVFTEEAFRSRCGNHALDADDMLCELRKHGFRVKRNPKRITDARIRAINSRYGIREAMERVDAKSAAYPAFIIG